MQTASRLFILCGCIVVVAFALEATWNQPDTNRAAEAVATGAESDWRYTKYGWENLRNWRNVQEEVKPQPPTIHPLAWAFGVLVLALGAMILIGDKAPEEKPIMAELRRQQLLNIQKH